MEVYVHFKGDTYLKLYEAEHSETGEIFVVYANARTGKIYIRPKEMFYDDVDKPNYRGKRFVKKENV